MSLLVFLASWHDFLILLILQPSLDFTSSVHKFSAIIMVTRVAILRFKFI